MRTFEEIRAAMDALEEAHGIKISLQYETYIGQHSRAERCQCVHVYIKNDESESFPKHFRSLPFECDPIPFIQDAVDEWLESRDERKARDIARARALLASLGG